MQLINIINCAKIKKSLCTAYKSTVQTEQAMNLYIYKFMGLGPDGQQGIIYLWDSKNVFYRYFYMPFQNIP